MPNCPAAPLLREAISSGLPRPHLLELEDGLRARADRQRPASHGRRHDGRHGGGPPPEESPLGGLLWVKVVDAVDGHVVLRDERGDLQLVLAYRAVQELDAGEVVHFVFDRGRHERREPPRHHLQQTHTYSSAPHHHCTNFTAAKTPV